MPVDPILATPPTGSAFPVWLWQLFPKCVQDFWTARPAALEFLWASGGAGTGGMLILVVTASQAGAFATALSTWLWLQAHWWGLLTAAVIAAYRGNTARTKAAATAAKGL